jgi:hypothetical protein
MAKRRSTASKPNTTVPVNAIDSALNEQRANLFQAMGIVRMAIDTIREPALGERSITAAWTALDGAYTLLSKVADRLQDSETMLSKEVSRGEY